LIDFLGEILKIVKRSCDPVLCQVTGIVQTISKLGRFLPDPPQERVSLIHEAIADYDPRCWATRNLPVRDFLFCSRDYVHHARIFIFVHVASGNMETIRWDSSAAAIISSGGAFSKRYSLQSHVLFNSEAFNPSELFWKMVGG
jgi:hypothetical protein